MTCPFGTGFFQATTRYSAPMKSAYGLCSKPRLIGKVCVMNLIRPRRVLWRAQQLTKRLCVRGEKQPILLTAGRRFRFNDVRQTRDGNLHAVDDKQAPFVPDVLELEAGHHEREVDLQLAACRARESAPRDNRICDKAIVRRIERLVVRPQREAGLIARIPCTRQIVGIRREEEMSILCGDHGSGSGREVVCTRYANENKSDVVVDEVAHELLKLVAHALRLLHAAIMIEELRLRLMTRRLIGS